MAIKDVDNLEAVRLYEASSSLYVSDSKLDSAALALVKAARLLKDDDDRAVNLLHSACEMWDSVDGNKLAFAMDSFTAAVSFMVRVKRFEDAIRVLHRQSQIHQDLDQAHGIARVTLSIIVLHLASNDFNAAHAAYEEGCSGPVATSDEVMLGGKLLSAFHSADEENVKRCCNEPIFKFLDNQVARVAVSLSLDKVAVPESVGGSVEVGDFGEIVDEKPAAPAAEEEEFGDDLT